MKHEYLGAVVKKSLRHENPMKQKGRLFKRTQSLLATAKLNGLEPLRWLTETLEKLPTCPNSQIDSLLPFAKPGK